MLAVAGVEGSAVLPDAETCALPALLARADSAVSAVLAHERELLLLLQGGRVVPEFAVPESASYAEHS